MWGVCLYSCRYEAIPEARHWAFTKLRFLLPQPGRVEQRVHAGLLDRVQLRVVPRQSTLARGVPEPPCLRVGDTPTLRCGARVPTLSA